jgi:transcriptional regulator with PAS, ATPase and Fis domain
MALQRERMRAPESPHIPRRDDMPGLIGKSPAFQSAVGMAIRVAGYAGANVLLVGETGTGKEMFARAIHNASRNAGEPFVAINCSAIPETMLESELFGHEQGAFTDARVPKRGLLEVAGRGTVLLDEVNELPLNLQPKLLRVLEERKVRRLGAVSEYDVSCRVIAATGRDLSVLATEGKFRTDLFYRLNVLRVELPPLRERMEDIEELAEHLVERICQEHAITPKRLQPDAIPVLYGHPWLGNVRELKNAIERAVVICDGDLIGPEHILLRKRETIPTRGDVILARLGNGDANGTCASSGAEPDGPALRIPAAGMTLAEMEKLLIGETLRRTSGNRARAARMLGISRPTVLRKIGLYGLDA